MKKISGVYKIENTITGDCYVGSSKDVNKRWAAHKCPSSWKRHSNSPMYLDMQKYGTDKFDFQILVNVEPDQLKEKEQEFIEILQPTYNRNRAKVWDDGIRKEQIRKAFRKYYKSEKGKKAKNEYQKRYQKSNRGRESARKSAIKYSSQLCSYNGETLTLRALAYQFSRAGVKHPYLEAKKYLGEIN